MRRSLLCLPLLFLWIAAANAQAPPAKASGADLGTLFPEVHKLADAAGEVEWGVAIDSTIARVHQHGATLTRGTGGRIESQESVVVGAA